MVVFCFSLWYDISEVIHLETWGERIKVARESAGLTQEQLGKKLGITGVTIMRYEKNQRQPRLEQLGRIALALGTTVYEMMGQDWDGWTVIDKSDSFDEDPFKTEKARTRDSARQIDDEDIKFALFGGDGEITDAMYEEVKRFAQMVKLREEAEKKRKG